MQSIAFVTIFVTLISVCQAKVTLTKGVNQTVMFDEDELVIKVDNPQRQQKKKLVLCFGASIVKDEFCPRGYTGTAIKTDGTDETLKLSRKGKLSFYPEGGKYVMDGEVLFGDDNTVNVLITEMPDGATVTLPNAHIPVTTTTTTVEPNKKASYKTVVLILFVIFLFAAFVIIGITAWYFCFCRRRKNQTVAVLNEQLGLGQERMDQRTGQPKAGAQKPPSAITTTRTTTSTAKANEEKPRVNSNLKPTQSKQSRTVSRIDCVSIRPATTLESISDSQIR